MKTFALLKQTLFVLLSLTFTFNINSQESNDIEVAEIEDVITTARRREESVKDVPIAIKAFSGDALEESGINNMEYLEELVPGLSVGNSIFAQNSVAIGIRGLGATRSSVQWDQKIAVYVDDAYQIRPQGTLFDLFDVNNVQILKGPQGTLFGKNTTTGAILVNNNTPNVGKFESSVKVQMGQRFLTNIAAMTNIPLTSSAALRVVAMQKKQDGYIKNLDTFGKDSGQIDNFTGRAMLGIDFTDRLNLLYTLSTFETSGTALGANCNVYTSGTSLPAAADSQGAFTSAQKQRVFDNCSSSGHYETYHDESFGGQDMNVEKTQLKLTYDLDIGSLSFIHATAESDDKEAVWGFGNTSSEYDDMYIVGPRQTTSDGETTEIRFSGAAMNDKIQYTVGYFESEVDGTGINDTILGSGFEASSTPIPSGPFAGLPVNLSDVATMAVTQLGNATEYLTSSSQSEAVYAEITYSATDRLNLTMGYRSSEDTKAQTLSAKYPEGGMNLNPTYLTIGLVGASPLLGPLAAAVAPFQVAGLDAWEISLTTGSARYHASKCDPVYGSFSNPLSGGTGLCTIERTYENDSMRFIADYTFDNGNMIYASYSEGYMPGNASDSIIGSGSVALPEELTEVVEVGTKSSFMDGKLQVEAAIYNQDYLNKSSITDGTTAAGTPTIVTTIQPVVAMEGYEFDLTYQFSDSISLGMGYAYVEGDEGAELEYNVFGSEDGSYNLSLTHTGMLANIPTTTVLRSYTTGENIDSTYKNSPGMDCNPIPTYSGCISNGGNGHLTMPEYTLVNLNVNMMVSESTTVNLFIENLADEEYSFAGFDTSAIGYLMFYSGPPRTAGISFTKNF
ncbi:MAG: TonB-dependent receptor [Gammaproteobacteria bacterium]|tara:strand:- start:413 stop:2950 length:2538 start_codon:yes stop_codon:yes gene_type:complete